MSETIDLLNVRLIGDEFHFTLTAGVFEEPAAWGGLFADVARQVAQALHEDEKRDPAQTLRLIKAAFVTEMERAASGAGE